MSACNCEFRLFVVAGYFSQERATACTPCPAGSAQQAVGQSSCKMCAPGTISSFNASTLCESCSPGSFQAASGKTECMPVRSSIFGFQLSVARTYRSETHSVLVASIAPIRACPNVFSAHPDRSHRKAHQLVSFHHR
jgi:hypothetical protein